MGEVVDQPNRKPMAPILISLLLALVFAGCNGDETVEDLLKLEVRIDATGKAAGLEIEVSHDPAAARVRDTNGTDGKESVEVSGGLKQARLAAGVAGGKVRLVLVSLGGTLSAGAMTVRFVRKKKGVPSYVVSSVRAYSAEGVPVATPEVSLTLE